MEVPVYNGKESINKYMQRVEKYKSYFIKDKYDIILKFINEWLNTTHDSLAKFKNINETTLLKNNKHNRDIVRKYCDVFQKKFNVDLSIDEETSSEEINDKYIIYLLMKMLNLIEYSLTKKEFNKKTYYTIKKN